ncbi:hypothetical protein GP486_000059 [Trichoglossum hirsutum]|uniref:Sensitive to high expression protein 9, mitochondrial n=1 Tax=Trichoglossum hirsutum TaxID=265104 RepID=A0A9P8RUB4_9PEZI|nr:hypothetical protein GP486_000059 [Trichoglossum hirsutum]
MPPLFEYFSRRAFESTLAGVVRVSSRPTVNPFASTCLQCRRRAQFRQYTHNHPHPSTLKTHGLRQREASGAPKSLSGSRPFSSLRSSDPLAPPSSTPSETLTKFKDDRQTAQFKRQDLPSQEEDRRSQVSKRFSRVMDNLQSNVFLASQRLNDLTGYSGIEALKRDIEEQGKGFEDLRTGTNEGQ